MPNYPTVPRAARRAARALAVAAAALAPAAARAQSFDFQGTFARDDQHQLFQFLVLLPGTVDLRSYGYGGGTTPSGLVVTRGGFDTILSLFDGGGRLIARNDDGPGAATDPTTGVAADARITTALGAGNYTLAVTEYDNFAVGPNLSAGFAEDGQGNFTNAPGFATGAPCPSGGFRDFTGTAGRCRTGNYTLAFSGAVSSVSPVTPAILPEPATALLLAPALGVVALARRLTPRA